jgi:hypothetical protein
MSNETPPEKDKEGSQPARRRSGALHIVWLLFTVFTLVAAGLISMTPGAERRLMASLVLPDEVAPIHQEIAGYGEPPEVGVARLELQAKSNAAERQRLEARLASLEQQMDLVTGSLKPVPPEAETDAAPMPAPNPSDTQARAPQSEPVGQAGIDLGTDKSIATMRERWLALSSRNESLHRLKALIQVRDAKDGAEIHLVAGPLADAGAAAQLCKTLSAYPSCAPANFDGQALAVR